MVLRPLLGCSGILLCLGGLAAAFLAAIRTLRVAQGQRLDVDSAMALVLPSYALFESDMFRFPYTALKKCGLVINQAVT